MANLLIVEDHEAIRDGLAAFLRQDGHDVETRADGWDWETWPDKFDLFILDVMLPGLDGFELAGRLRVRTSAPIVFITARGHEDDRLHGWELGASDYVVKPFSSREVVYRVRGLLARRPGSSDPWIFRREGATLTIDPVSRRAWSSGAELDLTPAEREILLALAQNPGVAWSRSDLMKRALGYYVDTGVRTIDTHVKNLRSKLGPVTWIESVRAFGYRFQSSPVDPS